MAFIADRVLDNGLSALSTEATRLDICSSEPTSYTEATSTAPPSTTTGDRVGAPAARSPDGRKVTVASISDGSVSGTGTASHWALTDPGNSRLLATGALSASQAVTSGNTFTLAAFDIGIPGAV